MWHSVPLRIIYLGLVLTMKCSCGSRSFIDGMWREEVNAPTLEGVRQASTLDVARFSSLRLRCCGCGEYWTLISRTPFDGKTLSIFVQGDVQASEQTFAAAMELSHLEDRVRRLEKDLSSEHTVR